MSALDTEIVREALDDHGTEVVAARPVGDRPMCLLVATDGRPQSDLALLAARRIAANEPLGILTVLPKRAADVVRADEGDAVDGVAHRGRVEWQVRRVLGNEVRTSIELRAGDPPIALAAAAARHGDPLLVVGIGRPKVSDRLLGDESALRVVRAAQTPVLAIAPGCAIPAHSIIIAVDFSPTSFAAAQLALRLAAPGAEALLVHVGARRGEIAWGSAAAGFRGDAELALENWRERLRRGFSGTLTPVVLHGDPATELMAIASHRGADLVAVGAYGHGPESRGDIGSVTARIVRCASYSVVVAPRCEEAHPCSVRTRRSQGTT